MQILFLCGAGASKFGGPCTPALPPLGAGGELFHALQSRTFQFGGGVAATISGAMAEEFKRDFESGMAMFMRERESDVVALLREMGFFFLQFRPGTGHYYRRLIQTCRHAGAEPSFATTNYELLIELSIKSEGLNIHLGEEPRPPNSISVFKLHGSSNFVVRPPAGVQMTNVRATGVREHFRGMHVSAEWPENAIPLLYQHRDFAPSMSLYAVGKQVLFSGEMVENARKQFARLLTTAARTYVIGLRVNEADEHIWGALAAVSGWLGYVGKEPDVFEKWAKRTGRRNTQIVASTFDHAIELVPEHLRTAM